MTDDSTAIEPGDELDDEAFPTNDDDDSAEDDVDSTGDVITDAQAAIEESRQRLADVPVDVVVTNHVMGLYELAAIHLGSTPPDLRSARLAIDAMACLVDGLGDRLGQDGPTLRDALGNIRMAFVQIKATAVAAAPTAESPDHSAS